METITLPVSQRELFWKIRDEMLKAHDTLYQKTETSQEEARVIIVNNIKLLDEWANNMDAWSSLLFKLGNTING